jgi:hypothetical protein
MYDSITDLLTKFKTDCRDGVTTFIQARSTAMPYLILFLLVFMLGLMVSCVIS